jgi:hypothetical protein
LGAISATPIECVARAPRTFVDRKTAYCPCTFSKAGISFYLLSLITNRLLADMSIMNLRQSSPG